MGLHTTRLTFTASAPTKVPAIAPLASATASPVTRVKAAHALPAPTTATVTAADARFTTSTKHTLHGILTTLSTASATQDTVVPIAPSVIAQEVRTRFCTPW